MRKAKVTFDITEKKTEVTVIDSKGISENLDITGTKMEKGLIRLLKQISQENQVKEIKNAMDIGTWQES